MPRENIKRGRRAEAQKRKRDDFDNVAHPKTRRRTSSQNDPPNDNDTTTITAADGAFLSHPVAHYTDESAGLQNSHHHAKTFYGLLDDEEQEYFKRADGMLQINQFDDAEERRLFVENVHKEAAGKELKLACSQSCSRLLERLILLSSPAQLKSLFHQFSGQFLNLVQHRFASHCCETLFIQAAPIVTRELLAGPKGAEQRDGFGDEPDPASYSMEDYFLRAVEELDGNVGYLITDKFASHTLRVLLMVLSGDELDATSQRSVLRSRKKEDVDVIRSDKAKDLGLEARAVPESFETLLQKITADSLSGLEPNSVRTLATHPVGNPMLQLLLHLEVAHFGKQRAKEDDSIIRRLLPDDPLARGTESASFVNGLMYDPIGSRLLESIVEHAPGKLFKAMYKELFRDRMGSLARNEIASYVVSRILERLGAEELQAAMASIYPQMPDLAQRGRTGVVKTLVERCAARGVDTAPLAAALQGAYAPDEQEPTSFLVNMLQLPQDLPASIAANTTTSSSVSPPHPPPTPESPAKSSDNPSTDLPMQTTPQTLHRQHHTTALAQAMLQTPGPLSSLLHASLTALAPKHILHISRAPPLSPILQSVLMAPTSTLILRRKLITRLFGHFAALSQHPAASRVVDAVERGTRSGLAFVRERVAEELAESEAQLRDSGCGRKVWRNWRMDLYRRRRGVWVGETRREVGNAGFQSFPGGADEGWWGGNGDGDGDEGREERDDGSVPLAVRRKGKDKRKVSGDSGAAEQEDKTRGGKTPLQLARERHALGKSKAERPRHQHHHHDSGGAST